MRQWGLCWYWWCYNSLSLRLTLSELRGISNWLTVWMPMFIVGTQGPQHGDRLTWEIFPFGLSSVCPSHRQSRLCDFYSVIMKAFVFLSASSYFSVWLSCVARTDFVFINSCNAWTLDGLVLLSLLQSHCLIAEKPLNGYTSWALCKNGG